MTTIEASRNLDAAIEEVNRTYREWSEYSSMYGTPSHVYHAYEVALASYKTAITQVSYETAVAAYLNAWAAARAAEAK